VYGTEPLLKRLGDYRVLDEDDDDPVLLTADGRPVDTWREGYPYDERMARTDYEREKRLLQIELLKLQNWMKDAGGRLIVLFEGRRRPVRRKVRESARYAARR
jgi:polyphosphate kinase